MYPRAAVSSYERTIPSPLRDLRSDIGWPYLPLQRYSAILKKDSKNVENGTSLGRHYASIETLLRPQKRHVDGYK